MGRGRCWTQREDARRSRRRAVPTFWLLAGLSTVLGCSDFEVRQTLARLGHGPAQHLLGQMYATGDQVPENSELAARWFKAAAEQDRPLSQFYLGMLYADEGRPIHDPEKAVRWVRAAAQQDMPAAQGALAEMLLAGSGVERDVDEAMLWYRKAADGGSASAKNNLAVIVLRQTSRAPASDAKAERERQAALAMLREAAEKGFPAAQRNLGKIYLSTEMGERNLSEGIYWLGRAAALGDRVSKKILEEIHQEAPAQTSGSEVEGQLD